MGGRGERGEEAGGERDGRWSCGGGSGGGLFYPAPFCWHPQHGHLRSFAKLIVTGQTIFVVSRKWFSLPFLPNKKISRGGLTSGAIWHIIMASCFSACSAADSPACPHALAALRRSGTCGSSSPLVLMFPTFAPWDITVRPSQHPPCPPCALSYRVPCAPAASDVLLSR